MINEQTLQSRIDEFQLAVSELEESVGAIGNGESSTEIPDTTTPRERLYEALTTAAIKGQVRLSSKSESEIINKVFRIEQQSFLRGETPDGSAVILNLMNYDTVEIL